MTKYILNSGNTKSFPEKEQTYYQEILKGPSKNPRILSCFFAQPREDWEERFLTQSENFRGRTLLPDLSIELAFPKTFEKQVRQSDIIIFHGGDDHLLHYWLSKFDLSSLVEGKTVAGSSAGANVLCKYFWTCDWREAMDGLGLLPIKFIPHFNSTTYAENDPRGPINWSVAYKELKSYGDTSLPIHTPEEGDFIILEK